MRLPSFRSAIIEIKYYWLNQHQIKIVVVLLISKHFHILIYISLEIFAFEGRLLYAFHLIRASLDFQMQNFQKLVYGYPFVFCIMLKSISSMVFCVNVDLHKLGIYFVSMTPTEFLNSAGVVQIVRALFVPYQLFPIAP